MSMPFSMPMCQMSLPFSAAPTILPPAPALLHLHKSFFKPKFCLEERHTFCTLQGHFSPSKYIWYFFYKQ